MVSKMEKGGVEGLWRILGGKGCVVIYGTCRASLGGWCLRVVENAEEVTVT